MANGTKIFCGIDPGVTGAIAFLFDVGQLEVFKMPNTAEGMHELFKGIKTNTNRVYTALETVHASPKQGSSRAFSFGKSAGWCEMVAEIFSDRIIEVSPQKWERALNCMTGGDKRISHEKAQKLFPTESLTQQVSDAVLLAFYAYRTFKDEG